MKYIVETQKSVDQAEADLCAAVQRHELVEGARRSTMDELADATATADKVLVF